VILCNLQALERRGHTCLAIVIDRSQLLIQCQQDLIVANRIFRTDLGLLTIKGLSTGKYCRKQQGDRDEKTECQEHFNGRAHGISFIQ
jgi:hypothetical protein